ncbi:MAG: hypothetical protein ACRCUM_03065 [Mycoplasmoidaceae bacterium]
MKKFNKRKAIITSLSSIIFVTTLSVFISFLISPNIKDNSLENNNQEIRNITFKEEVIKNENINSLIKIEKSVNGYSKYFDSLLIRKNLPIVIKELVNSSENIKYPYDKLLSNLFFKIISNDEISIKVELIPHSNKHIKYLAKFKLIIK